MTFRTARVIDNFSRRILSWKLVLRLEPQTTCQILVEAAKNLPKNGDGATVVADSGIENVNGEVDSLWGLGQLHRILAQVEVSYSNSMIEALWRSMKHGWLFLHQLDTFAALERLISFYVEQHNSVVPHSAFAGQTPDEMYFGHGEQIPVDLAAARAHARSARMKYNRELSCEACRLPVQDTPETSNSSAISSVLQLREGSSAMSRFAAGLSAMSLSRKRPYTTSSPKSPQAPSRSATRPNSHSAWATFYDAILAAKMGWITMEARALTTTTGTETC